jgi:hypothetical protein
MTLLAAFFRFVERAGKCDRVIVVGTPLYRTKYENDDPKRGYVAAAEGDVIGMRMIGTETGKEAVLPVLLEGMPESAFPVLLQGRVFADFRKVEAYFDITKSHRGIRWRTICAIRCGVRGNGTNPVDTNIYFPNVFSLKHLPLHDALSPIPALLPSNWVELPHYAPVTTAITIRIRNGFVSQLLYHRPTPLPKCFRSRNPVSSMPRSHSPNGFVSQLLHRRPTPIPKCFHSHTPVSSSPRSHPPNGFVSPLPAA